MDLLEREGILDELHGRLRQAAAGRGSLILLGGEAGVGKSALLRQFLGDVREQATVLTGQCDALSTPRALGPFFDIAVADEVMNRLLTDGSPREILYRGALARLRAGSRPTVLAVEDAHWADEASLDLLRYLGRRLEESHGLILVTYRDDEVGTHHPLRRLLGDLATTAAVVRLELPALSPAAIAIMAAGTGLDVTELYARTRGNPFYVTEVLAAVGGIPPTVRDAVLARASRLSSGAWSVLEAAAVLGSPIDPDVLDGLADPLPRELEDAVSSGILQVREDGPGYTFRHELGREAILSAITPSRRTLLHARVLHLLETSPGESHDPARLAFHAEEAGDPSAVLRYAPEAARRAARLQSHHEAADQYGRCLRCADSLDPESRAALFEALANECYLTAQLDRAMYARNAALDIWRQLGILRKEGENRCQAANLLWAQARIADAEREAEAAVTLLEALPAGPELALAYGTLARLRGTTLADDDAIRLGERAAALAEQFGSTETRIDALMTVGEANLARGGIDRGRDQLEATMQVAIDSELDGLTARAFISLGYGFAECGRLHQAVSYFDRGIRFCAERDLDLPRFHLTALLAKCHLDLGNWDESYRLANLVLDAREVPPGTRFAALVAAGLVLSRRGDALAARLLDEAVVIAETSECIYFLGPAHAACAEAAALSGDAAESVAETHAAYDLAVARGHRWFTGELAYWRAQGGTRPSTPANLPEPYELQLGGDWEAAGAAWDALGCPYEAARARSDGDEAALLTALLVFERLGARPMADHVRQRLRSRGVRGVPRGPRPSTRANRAGLTTRQADILALLGEGLSNQGIANRLFLSPRTVENHVASILTKLGAATRGDAVAAAQALGPSLQPE